MMKYVTLILCTLLWSLTESRVDVYKEVKYQPQKEKPADLKFRGGGAPLQNPGCSAADNSMETRTLDELYHEALKEGGRVIVYAGGDTPDQQDEFKHAFEKQFPGMTLDVIVDYSKNHNGRIENQLRNGNLIPDVVQLQSLQDFPRWKRQGILMKYKPRGWTQIYNEFKDPDGFHLGIYIITFTNCANRHYFPNSDSVPRDAEDYLRADLRGRLTITYPNDDDAILFYYKQIVDKYGWEYVRRLQQQNPRWVRGTAEPFTSIIMNRTDAYATPATWCPFTNSVEDATYIALPRKDPFVTWPQTAAIFRNARRPAGAKLYLNWITEAETHVKCWPQWSTRRDVPAPAGFRSVFDYRGQTDPTAFGRWTEDRGQVELFRSQMTLYIGEVQGKATPMYPGLYPEKAISLQNNY